MCSLWCCTFESFFIKDDCVVFWCLRQTEKLTSEKEEVGGVQMADDMQLEIEKICRQEIERSETGREQCYSLSTNRRWFRFS